MGRMQLLLLLLLLFLHLNWSTQLSSLLGVHHLLLLHLSDLLARMKLLLLLPDALGTVEPGQGIGWAVGRGDGDGGRLGVVPQDRGRERPALGEE